MGQNFGQILPRLELDRVQLAGDALQRDQSLRTPPRIHEGSHRHQNALAVQQCQDLPRSRVQSQDLSADCLTERGDLLEPPNRCSGEQVRGAIAESNPASSADDEQCRRNRIQQRLQVLELPLALGPRGIQDSGGPFDREVRIRRSPCG